MQLPPGEGKSKDKVIVAGMYQRRLAPMWKDKGHWKINLAQMRQIRLKASNTKSMVYSLVSLQIRSPNSQ